jgi:hypothetical protein
MNAYQKIQKGIRNNERSVLAHIRRFGPVAYERCSLSWMKAIDRLKAKGIVKFGNANRLRSKSGYYIQKKK